jgi:hypothetical protein
LSSKKPPTPSSAEPAAPVSRQQRRQELVKDSKTKSKKQYDKNKREMTIIKIVSGVLVAALILGLGFWIVKTLQDRNLNQEPDGVKVFTYVNNQHVDGDIDYSAQADYQGEVPPAGGAHNPTPQQCGVYTAEIRTENAVHSLEHGAVWITYQPTLAADQIQALTDMADGDDYILMSPYEGLPSPIVLTAWNHQLQMDSFDKETVEKFLRSYKNKSGITPELGASCAGVTTTK